MSQGDPHPPVQHTPVLPGESGRGQGLSLGSLVVVYSFVLFCFEVGSLPLCPLICTLSPCWVWLSVGLPFLCIVLPFYAFTLWLFLFFVFFFFFFFFELFFGGSQGLS